MQILRIILISILSSLFCLTSLAYAASAHPGTSASAPAASTIAADSEKININTANADQLVTLKGIGTAKAQAIIDYRSQQGPFKTAEELSKVKGFSEKIVATLLKNNPNKIAIE
jgi:competence protein ComEA